MSPYNNNYDPENEQNKIFDDMKKSRKNSLIVFIIVIVAYLVYAMFFQSNPDCQGTSTGRTALDSSKCVTLVQYIYGSSEYTEDDDSLLHTYMVAFHNSTGVQPVIYDNTGKDLMSQSELNEFAEEFYATEMFTSNNANYDEGHFLLVFQADGDSYMASYYLGSDAKTVLDDSAMDTFMSNLDSYFHNDSKKGNEKLASTYSDSASTIMGRSTSTTYFIIGIIVILVIYGAFSVRKNMKKNNSENGGN